MPFAIAPSFDQQGSEMKALGLKEMKKSPSAVFSWPMFVTNSSSEAVMAPIKNLVQVRSTDTVRSVLWTLIKNKVECVPVFNESTRKYVGFVDMFDLVLFIANAAGNAAVKSDFFQVFKRAPFGDAQVAKITNAASKDHCTSVTETAPLSAMFDLTVSANLAHVPVMNKHKVLAMVSQARMVRYLVQNKASFSQLAAKTLDLSGTDNAYTVEENTPCVSAFVYMAEKGVKGVAIVNKDGQFVDAINSFDVKGLVQGDFFSDLRQPVLRYLSKSRILIGKNQNPVTCTSNDTLSELLEKMARERIYRIFVVDENKIPVSVISLRDILKVLHSYQPIPEPSSFDSRRLLCGSGGQ